MHFLYLPCGISTDLPRKLNLLFIFGLLSFGEGGLMKILHVLNRGGVCILIMQSANFYSTLQLKYKNLPTFASYQIMSQYGGKI
jgi:hypothetical protein